MRNVSSIKFELSKKKDALQSFCDTFLEEHPEVNGQDIGTYALLKMSETEAGTREYDKWASVWNQYCDLTGPISRLSTQLSNASRLIVQRVFH